MLKILIADDSNSDRLLLETIIKKQGHKTILAENGLQAIDLFNAQKPDIILLDALMPELDGFGVAQYIKENSGDDFYPIIFLTSLHDAQSLVKCLEVGGDDFLTKPYNHVILKAKINAFTRMQAMHSTLQSQRDQIASNNTRLIEEQELAKYTFDKIAHEGCLHAGNIKHMLSPMAIFNGDVLLAARRPNGNLALILGDFTGHGLAAAMGAIPLSQAFYSMVSKGFDIAAVVKELNAKLKEILPIGVFCCACIVDMDFRKQRLEVWNGGLPDNFIFRSATNELEVIQSHHLPLGILSNEKFQSDTISIDMSFNDRFYIWSDGILEAENQLNERFGEERIKDIFFNIDNADLLFKAITNQVEGFIGSTERSDDLSLAELTMVDKETFEAYGIIANLDNNEPISNWSFSIDLNAEHFKTLDPLPLIKKILVDTGLVYDRSSDFFVILFELYNNALEHGVLGLSSSIKSSSDGFKTYYQQRQRKLANLTAGFINISINYTGSNLVGSVVIKITDSGEGYDYQSLLAKQAGKNYSGRGLLLVRQLCEKLVVSEKGNEVEVVFCWGN